jgi:putative transposase
VWRTGEDPAAAVLHEGVRWLAQERMEAEVSAQIGAGHDERSDERTTQRTGYRNAALGDARGHLELASSTPRTGTSCPSWLEARQAG